MLEAKTGQILIVINENGLLALNENMENWPADKTIKYFPRILSKKIPTGEIILCLDIINIYVDNDMKYHLKILWRENVYYVICNYNDVKII